jgi:hypothetical protein
LCKPCTNQGLENLTNLVTKYDKHLQWKEECFSQSKVIHMTTIKKKFICPSTTYYMNSLIGWSYKTFSNPKLHSKNSMILQSFWIIWFDSHQLNIDLYYCRQTPIMCSRTYVSFFISNIIFPLLFFLLPFSSLHSFNYDKCFYQNAFSPQLR